MLRQAARKAILSFDRPGLRGVISTLYTVAGRFSRYGASQVRYQDGGWVHRFSDGYLIEHQPRIRGYDLTDERNSDYCGQLYSPSEGDTIVDAGAGFGSETIYFARKVGPTGTVIAIEAHPYLANALSRSVALNGFANVKVLNLAVAEENKKLFIEDDLAVHRTNAVNGSSGIEVEAKSLDAICADLPRIDFIKMNIEGAEQLAIKGMTETIRRTRFVAISCHDFVYESTGNPFFRTKAMVEEWLKERGWVIVPRQSQFPWLAEQVNAYNPALS